MKGERSRSEDPAIAQERVHVLIVNDPPIFRRGLADLVRLAEDMVVVDTVAPGSEALARVLELRPDVIVLASGRSVGDDSNLVTAIRRQAPDASILVLGDHRPPHELVRMIRAGIAGYLGRYCTGTDLVDAIRAIARGESYL